MVGIARTSAEYRTAMRRSLLAHDSERARKIRIDFSLCDPAQLGSSGSMTISRPEPLAHCNRFSGGDSTVLASDRDPGGGARNPFDPK